MSYQPATERILAAIREIPYGRVSTYGAVAERAGMPRGARQVARTLSSLSGKEQLPWHRVVNSAWCISLQGEAAALQRQLLLDEGVCFEAQRVARGYRWL